MPTLRRLAATELISFSLIHDLNSLTAKAADTPEQKCQDKLCFCFFSLNVSTVLEKKTTTCICVHTNVELAFWGGPKEKAMESKLSRSFLIFSEEFFLTLFDEVLIEEAVQDGG